jgi:hypothetical protein
VARNRKKDRLPPFVPMTWKMLHSRAYKGLPPSAAKVLPYFIGKVQRIGYQDPARYETTFILPYAEAGNYGFGKTTFYNCIKALMKFGFIDPVRKGGLRGFGNTPNVFKLPKRWETYGTSDFKEIRWESFLTVPRQLSNVNPTPLKIERKRLGQEKTVSEMSPVEDKK